MQFSVRGLAVVALALVVACSAPAAETGAYEEILSNQDIIDLLNAGLAEELVEEKIRTSRNRFDMSTKAMIQLKEAKVSDNIIRLMLRQRQTQLSQVRSKIQLDIQHLASPQAEMRDAALIKLREHGEPALAQLRSSLSTSRAELREQAALALGRLGDQESLPLLRTLLQDTSPGVRHAAAEALFMLQDEGSREVARTAIVDGMIPMDGHIRLLGFFKDPQAVGFLKVRLLEESDPVVREQAAWALGETGGPGVHEPLEHALLKDRAPEVRRMAALSLGKLHHPDSSRVLIEACTVDPQVRREVMAALADFPPAVSVPFLVSTLRRRLTVEETETAINSLRRLTHEDFGSDHIRWASWLDSNRAALGLPEAAAPLAPAAVEPSPRAADLPSDDLVVPPLPTRSSGTPSQPMPTRDPSAALMDLPRHAAEVPSATAPDLDEEVPGILPAEQPAPAARPTDEGLAPPPMGFLEDGLAPMAPAGEWKPNQEDSATEAQPSATPISPVIEDARLLRQRADEVLSALEEKRQRAREASVLPQQEAAQPLTTEDDAALPAADASVTDTDEMPTEGDVNATPVLKVD